MHQIKSPINKLLRLIEHGLPLTVLAILLIFTVAKFWAHPYQGFRMDSNGMIGEIYVTQDPHQPALLVGDKLIQVDATTWATFQNDSWMPYFPEIRPGNQVSLVVDRLVNGVHQKITIPWKVPGPNENEIRDLLLTKAGWVLSFGRLGRLPFWSYARKINSGD